MDEVVTFKVTSNSGAAPSDIAWTFGDGAEGGGEITAHKWAAARSTPYNVAVTATVNGKQVTTSTNVTVTAKPTLTSRGGTVTGDGGINCVNTTCEYNLEPKTKITLVATPGQNHELGSWSGDCAGTTNTCDVTMDGPRNVTHTFKVEEPIEITLFVSGGIMGPGDKGTISLDGKPCSRECKHTIKRNQEVFLSRASTDENHTTGVWQNGCPGNAPSCRIRWDKSTTVSSNFPAKFLYLKVLPSPGGRVVGSHGINCPGVCEANFDSGEPVTLTAEPNAGKTFNTWGAGPPCGGFGAVCTPTFRESRSSVSASFK